jgi:hypothetical protein
MTRLSDRWKTLTARNAGEPRSLRWLFHASFGFIAVGSGLAICFAVANGLWAFTDAPHGVSWFHCQCQLKERGENDAKVQDQIRVAKARKEFFEASLSQPDPSQNPYFLIARTRLLEEEEAIGKLKAQATWYRVQSLRDSLWLLVGSFLVPVLLSFLAGRLMLIHGARCFGGAGPVRWKTAYFAFTGLGAGSIILREIFAGALAHGDRVWFSWMSFCICPGAWFSMWLAFIGLGLAVAYPCCVIWCYSRADTRPKSFHLQAPDGCWGVGRYVLFLQTWTVAIFVFVITGSVLYIDITAASGRFSIAYAGPPALLAAIAAVVGWRLLWNGIAVRLGYQRSLRSLGNTWGEIQAQKPPPDPTIGFLGDTWWKLPATIFGAFAALWALTQLLLRQGIFGSH